MELEKLNSLSDDGLAKIFLHVRQQLLLRGVELGDLGRSQVRVGELVTWTHPEPTDRHYGIVTKLNPKSVAVKEVFSATCHEPTGQQWKMGYGVVVPLGAPKPTNLEGPQEPIKPHEVQTPGAAEW